MRSRNNGHRGKAPAYRGNGGGGGGVRYLTSVVFPTGSTWAVSVGEGGKGGQHQDLATNGGVTSFTSASFAYTASGGGFGGQPTGGAGASGGGSYPSGAAAIFAESGSAGGTQQGKSGAGGGGAAGTGSDATTYFNNPFLIYNGGNGGPGKAIQNTNLSSSIYYFIPKMGAR